MNAILCDQCETMLKVNARGDDEYGERSAWITLGLAGEEFEVCSISCAQEFLNRGAVAEGIASRLELISDISRIIREDKDE